MASHNRLSGNTGNDGDLGGGLSAGMERFRRCSERSDFTEVSDNSVPPRRRPIVRSLTEVRPEPPVFSEGLFFSAKSRPLIDNEPAQTLEEEDEEIKQSEVIICGNSLK